MQECKTIQKSDKAKIGMISWFGESNYGTNLQACALYRKVRDLGYSGDLVKICYNSNKVGSWKNALYLSYIRLRNKIQGHPFNRCSNKDREVNVERFIINEASFYLVDSHRKMRTLNEQYDAFLVGSDQIWNPDYLCDATVLAFVKGKKKMSYASSIGVNSIPQEKLHYYTDYISKFDFIAVREKTGERLLRDVLKRDDVQTVVDPTFLLSSEEWSQMATCARIPSSIDNGEPFIFCYLVGQQTVYDDAVESIRQKSGIQKVVVVTADGYGHEAIDGVHFEAAGPYEFLWLTQHATLVCTDSFHSCTISLKFKVNFVVLQRFAANDKKSQSSRLVDLFASLGIDHRFYVADSDEWLQPIDFSNTDEKLKQWAEMSETYLKNALDS